MIDKIAAGEVVERPASVVKELLENSFDAGASAVQVEVEEGGLSRITVSDDGAAMDRADAERCVLRHATSKLRAVEDLDAIRSLGFRGEALSSIAAVADVTISTRPEKLAVGTRIRMVAGQRESMEDYGGPAGTTVDVQRLFENVPARRKFMRSPATEQAHVVEAALRVALGTRRGGVVVGAGSRRLLDIPEDQDEPERVKAALGPRVREVLPFAHHDDAGVNVGGYVASLDTVRGDSKAIWFFVNGRFVRERMLQRALIDVFRPILPAGRFPLAVLYVDVDPESVDVNVHPQKMEVRFSDPASVYRAVSTALTRLVASSSSEQVDAFTGRTEPVRRAVHSFAERARHEPALARGPDVHARRSRGDAPSSNVLAEGSGDYRPPPLQQTLPNPAARTESIGRRWAMQELSDSLLIVDLVAAVAAEAEAAMRDECLPGGGLATSELMLPEVFEPEGLWKDRIQALAPELTRFGLDIDLVGPNRFALRAQPKALCDTAPRAILKALEELELEAPLDAGDAGRLIHALAQTAMVPDDEAGREVVAKRWWRAGVDGVVAFRVTDDAFRSFLTLR
ncbi:MAG: DNA mismatch repair endonuclease MutL, partial [Myxococcota bacterium]